MALILAYLGNSGTGTRADLQVRARIDCADLTPAEKRMILRDNAVRVLRKL